MTKRLLKKYFNIHVGEYRIAFLMQFYIFLVITVLLLIKPTITALFIDKLGAEKLPYGFLLVAITAILSSFFYNNLVKRFAIKKVAIATILLFSGLFFTFSYNIHQNTLSDWILYAYYIILSLFGVMVTSQFWVISNIVFNIREAKRLFGFIGAGAIIGGIFGGYLASIIANYFGSDTVVLVAAILLLFCLPIILWIWNIRVNRLNKYIKKKRKKGKNKALSSNSFLVVLKSKHLINLSAVVGVSVLVAKLVDYQFSYFSHIAYPNSDELASFFGFWYSSFNIVALLIQLFLTNKLLTRFTLSQNMLILPVTLLFASILFLIFPVIGIAILLKGIDTSFKQSINKASFELSILPITYETKKQAKPFIDVVVDSIATGISGFLLLFIIKNLNIDPIYITLLTLFFLLVWFYLIVRIKKSYFNTFKENIKANTKSLQDKDDYVSIGIRILSKGNESDILGLLTHLKEDIPESFKPYILNLIDHPSDKIKALAIKEIYDYKEDIALEKIKYLALNSDDEYVVYHAMEYLLLHITDIEDHVYLSYLDHTKPIIKNTALLCLVKAAKYNTELKTKFNLIHRIQSKIETIKKSPEEYPIEEIAELLITIGHSGIQPFYSFITPYLESDTIDIELRTMAIKAAGYSHYEPFIAPLFNLITDKTHRPTVIESLQNYGEEIVSIIYNKLNTNDFKHRKKKYIPKIIEIFSSKKTKLILLKLLKNNDALVRLEASKSASKIKKYNHKSIISEHILSNLFFKECHFFKNSISEIQSIEKAYLAADKLKSEKQQIRKKLITLLQKQLDYSLEVIFYLLSIKYSYDDMRIAYLGLKNDTEESRINTVEFLSNLLEADLKKELLPLLEYRFLSDTDFSIEVFSETKSLLYILKTGNFKAIKLSLKLICFLDKKPYIKTIKALSKQKNKKTQLLAKTFLEQKK